MAWSPPANNPPVKAPVIADIGTDDSAVDDLDDSTPFSGTVCF
jgi:hypothetical protein